MLLRACQYLTNVAQPGEVLIQSQNIDTSRSLMTPPVDEWSVTNSCALYTVQLRLIDEEIIRQHKR